MSKQKPFPQSAHTSNTLEIIEELLVIFEETVSSRKKLNQGFNILLKRKFIEKADKYVFLDPFAGEFDYANRKISYAGEDSEVELAMGVVESVKELAEELGIFPVLTANLTIWTEKYSHEIAVLELKLK